MSCRLFFQFAYVFVVLGACHTALSQEPSDEPRTREVGKVKAEDLGIISIILQEDLQTLFRSTANDNDVEVALPLATYLPDFGVSIIVQTPSVVDQRQVEKKHSTSKPTRWENTAARVRGQALSNPFVHQGTTSGCAACHALADTESEERLLSATSFSIPTESQVVDVLKRTLSHEGHNLRGLPADQRVAITAILPITDFHSHMRDVHFKRSDLPWRSMSLSATGLASMMDPKRRQAALKQAVETYAEVIKARPQDDEAWRKLILAYKQGNADSKANQLIRTYLKNVFEGGDDDERRKEQIRRLYLDLTGVPIHAADLNQIVKGRSSDAARNLVEQLQAAGGSTASVALSYLKQVQDHDQAYGQYVASLLGVPSRTSQKTIRVTLTATKRKLDLRSEGEITEDQLSDSMVVTYLGGE